MRRTEGDGIHAASRTDCTLPGRPPQPVTIVSPRLVSGLRSVLADRRGAFPDFHPVALCRVFSNTVAGAAPDFNRLPNSPLSLGSGTLSVFI
jgi:hypothetical protein